MNPACPICSQLKDVETSFYKYAAPQYDQPLPAAAAQLVMVKDLGLPDAENHHLRRCPHCGALYRYDASYEYHVNGSEDEEVLTRLAEPEAAAYFRVQAQRLEGMRQAVLLFRQGAGSLVDYIDHGNPTPEQAREAWETIEQNERQEAAARVQLRAQVEAFRQTCPEIPRAWAKAHMRACQYYLDTLPEEGEDESTARYVARTSLAAWQQLVLSGETFIDDPSAWLEGYVERVEKEILL